MEISNSIVSELISAKVITETCEKHGVVFEKRERKGYGFFGVCPECAREEHDAKMLSEKSDWDRQETEHKVEHRNSRVVNSGLPKRFMTKTFQDYISETTDQQSVLSVAKEYSENRDAIKSGRGLIITGFVGVGKTHLAAAIINEIIKPDNKTTAIYTTARDMIRHIRSAWRNPEIDENDVIDRYAYTSMLVIDEIGVQFGSDSEMIQMFEVLDKRYGEQLPTVMISNLPIDELSALLGDRIIDRMREDNGVLLQLNWQSHRGAI